MAGGCCARQYAKDQGTPQASWDMFVALDTCVFCTTCKDLCKPDYDVDGYCGVIAAGGESMCPP